MQTMDISTLPPPVQSAVSDWCRYAEPVVLTEGGKPLFSLYPSASFHEGAGDGANGSAPKDAWQVWMELAEHHAIPGKASETGGWREEIWGN